MTTGATIDRATHNSRRSSSLRCAIARFEFDPTPFPPRSSPFPSRRSDEFVRRRVRGGFGSAAVDGIRSCAEHNGAQEEWDGG